MVIFTCTKKRNFHSQFHGAINISSNHKKQEMKMSWISCWVIYFIGSCKNIALKIEHFFCLLKMVSIWTPLHKIIVFCWTKCFNSYRLRCFCEKNRKSLSLFFTRKAGKSHFLPLICVIYSKKKNLKSCLNLQLLKKWTIKISSLFIKPPGYLKFFSRLFCRSANITNLNNNF